MLMRYLLSSVLSFASVLTAERVVADEKFNLGEPAVHRLDAYSRAAKLRPIDASRPELRVWVDNVMFGEITGFVISTSGATECHSKWHIEGLVMTVTAARCNPIAGFKQQEALALLGDLSKLNGKELGCGAMDGSDVSIDGSAFGQRFEVFASNPDVCRDSGSVLVAKLLRIVRDKPLDSTLPKP